MALRLSSLTFSPHIHRYPMYVRHSALSSSLSKVISLASVRTSSDCLAGQRLQQKTLHEVSLMTSLKSRCFLLSTALRLLPRSVAQATLPLSYFAPTHIEQLASCQTGPRQMCKHIYRAKAGELPSLSRSFHCVLIQVGIGS